ncbi:putative carboxylic ester hydrolase [Medicago truncatula]|uniref:Glycerolipase A1 n=2 Tax=Medicago truncatula TaxID=3880 RepID=A0A072U2S1_MEDTR|nr:glycerolipase A1 [Medicago truncatula]RHN47223.1 putative carboxylic ester hydrolase [Medicago truncatula]
MRLNISTPAVPSTNTYTLKLHCVIHTQTDKLIDNTQKSTLHLENTINLENHNNFPSLHSSPSSSSPPMDPKTKTLGKRWKEYQGMRNWDGLLDPLDDILRCEILRYGHFVEATYKSFEFDPSSSKYANCRFPKSTLLECCGLPNTGYKVTKYLHATSGIQLPSWMDKAPNWVATQSSYIGYVAVCDNKEEIKRLGRRDVVIAIRGTCTCLEWLENFRATLTNFSIPCNHNINDERKGVGTMVESGFLNLYTSSNYAKSSLESMQKMVKQEILRINQIYRQEELSLTITGHSLGAALATLIAYDVKISVPKLMVTVISFGGPRVGNRNFRQHLEKQGTKVLRIVNSDDVITKLPGFVFFDDVDKTPWMYAEVGKELRLCSRDSPYLGSTNVATCHELQTYLHLVDGFISSRCPFRASAKRFLRH